MSFIQVTTCCSPLMSPVCLCVVVSVCLHVMYTCVCVYVCGNVSVCVGVGVGVCETGFLGFFMSLTCSSTWCCTCVPLQVRTVASAKMRCCGKGYQQTRPPAAEHPMLHCCRKT